MYVFWANLYKTPIVLKRLACLTKSPDLVSIDQADIEQDTS